MMGPGRVRRGGGLGTDKRCPGSIGRGILNHRASLPRFHKHQLDPSLRSPHSLIDSAYHSNQLFGVLTNTSATIKQSLLHTQTQTRRAKKKKKICQGKIDSLYLLQLRRIQNSTIESIELYSTFFYNKGLFLMNKIDRMDGKQNNNNNNLYRLEIFFC